MTARAVAPADATSRALVLGLAGVVALGLALRPVTIDGLRWLLAPAVELVGLWQGVAFEWVPGEGYLARAERFVVTRDCSGLNFLIVAGTVLAMSWGRRAATPRDAARALAEACVAAFALATAANTVRLGVALELRRLDLRAVGLDFGRVHEWEGLLVYAAALALVARLATARPPSPATGPSTGPVSRRAAARRAA